VLNEKVDERKKLDMNMINWEKTIAWAIGAFEGQIFINLEGREPKGIVKQEELEKLLNEMEIKLKKITGDRYETLDTKIFMKKRDFSGKRDDKAPDMLIYFDNLQYGCNCSLVGNKTLWSPQTAIGSDDAGHSEQGIFIIKNGVQKGNIEEVDILEVSPIILKELGIEEQ
jgi:predicted AlkP superfamily phosphohydrolase/phosphomutase